ncbi:MAG: hypothetical protein QM820_45300 [Minicystis sp.]
MNQLGVLDRIEIGCSAGARLGADDAPPGIEEIMARDRAAIRPAGLGPEVKAIDPSIVAPLETVSDPLHGVQVAGMRRGEALEERVGERLTEVVRTEARIDVLRLRTDVDGERGRLGRALLDVAEIGAGPLAGAPRHQDRGADEQPRRPALSDTRPR